MTDLLDGWGAEYMGFTRVYECGKSSRRTVRSTSTRTRYLSRPAGILTATPPFPREKPSWLVQGQGPNSCDGRVVGAMDRLATPVLYIGKATSLRSRVWQVGRLRWREAGPADVGRAISLAGSLVPIEFTISWLQESESTRPPSRALIAKFEETYGTLPYREPAAMTDKPEVSRG